MEFYDEILNNDVELNEFTNGTENFLTDAFKKVIKKINTVISGRDLTSEDIEFMLKGADTLRHDMAKTFESSIANTIAAKHYKAKVMTDTSTKSAYATFKASAGKKYGYVLPLIDIYTNETFANTSENKQLFKTVMSSLNKVLEIIEERVPKGFVTDVVFPGGDHQVITLYSPEFGNMNAAEGKESIDINYIENVLSDDFLLGYDNPAMLFGMESINSRFSNYGFNDILDIINAEGGVESFVPVDMDFASYAELIEGTEGIGNFFARHWAKFRRVMHPLVKSDLKVSKVEYDKIKSTFETTVIRSIPALKNMLQQNRFIKYLLDNGALEINDKASKSFANDSRMVASIIVRFKSSKIKYDEKNGMLTIGGKKIDIMDLRDDEKFFKGNDATEVIYMAINDIIRAINKTVYKQIKGEHVLDKLGFAVKFLNDGTQRRVKQDGAVVYSTGDSYGSASTYTVEESNDIANQINNKDILIGMVSRPLVIKDAGVESFFDCSFDEMLEGGTEMASNTETIIERMKLVEDTKKQVMQTPEYQRFAAGIEARESIERTAGENSDMKELLGKVYDKYGMAGLKDILK